MMKTVFVIGAGSTVALGMPATAKQIDLFEEIGNSDEVADTLKRLKKICNARFGEKNSDGEYSFSVNDVFNLIDSNLLLHNGIYGGKDSLGVYELEECKKEFIAYLFNHFKKQIENRNKEKYEEYVAFYAKLAEKEIEKKKSLFYKKITDRNAFISSYSIVNFNWDLYSLLPIIEANTRVNHTGSHYLSIGRNPQLRIFTDFQCEYGGSDKNKLWYPFTEPSAFQVNSEKNDSLRRVITIKCFYPHGAMNVFKCPSCSKHSFYLGDLTIDGVNSKLNYKKTEEIYDCPYCGHKIGGFDFDILPQSNFKVRNSFLEEIHLSMISELENADRIVFIGYSMPLDDVDHHTMFRGLNAKLQEVYVVLKGKKKSANRFVEYNDLSKEDKQSGEIKRFCDTFATQASKHKLFFNMAGAPNAFDSIVNIF